jgi:endonuclease/exonuclease/phosphatase family metal-dependent hydrolase
VRVRGCGGAGVRVRGCEGASRALIVGVFCTALAASTACAARQPLSLAERTDGHDVVLAVVSWNVHVGRGDLPTFVDDLTRGALTGRPVDDFVVMLQETIEDGSHDVMTFARDRGLHAFFTPVHVSGEGVSGNAILSTRPLRNPREIVLPRIRRVRKAVVAEIGVGGREIFAVNAHLENRIGWLRLFSSDGARRRQTDALLDALPAGPGILGGDLNTWMGPTEPALRSLLNRFQDTPTQRLQPTFRDRLVLDHLFFDLPEGWSAAHEVVRHRYGSDHHPVLGVIARR